MDQAAEAIIRKRKGKAGEALRRLCRKVYDARTRIAAVCTHAGCGFFLSFAELAGIPSGFGAAWLASCAAEGRSMLLPSVGCLLALVMRLVWGLGADWSKLVTIALMLPGQRLLFGARTARLMLWTAASLLPGVIAALPGSTQRGWMMALASMAIGALAAPVMCRAQQMLREKRDVSTVEEYLAIGYTAALLLCGGARMTLLGVNIGILGAAVLTVVAAIHIGMGAGCMTGLISGAALAMQGLPVELSMCLAAAGFLAGMTQQYGRWRISCICFGMTAVTAMYVSAADGYGAAAAALAATVTVLLAPAPLRETIAATAARFRRTHQHGDEYAAVQLERWEQTVGAIIRGMPTPEAAQNEHTPAWWHNQLCAGCPSAEECTCMNTEKAAERADEVLAMLDHESDETALDGLRGLGCARLYHLREAMKRCAVEKQLRAAAVRRACYEHDVQAIHLTALAAAAKRFAAASPGGWWESVQAGRLVRAASERALPVRLLYVRRHNGHVQTAWRIEGRADAAAIASQIPELAQSVLGVLFSPVRQEGDVLYAAEKTIFSLDAGYATCGKIDDAGQNGDSVRMTMLQDGCFIATLSDGMGHGAEACRESGQTAELLQLCLEAGYTREQALAVVNAMMLAAAQGERFATVDMLTINLWSGHMTLDKLGASDSYLVQNGEMTCLGGDALPLGILEQAQARTCESRINSGDMLMMMSDGVEDAFETAEALQAAIRAASAADTAQLAAEMLLNAARKAWRGAARDDQTVVVLRMVKHVDKKHETMGVQS